MFGPSKHFEEKKNFPSRINKIQKIEQWVKIYFSFNACASLTAAICSCTVSSTRFLVRRLSLLKTCKKTLNDKDYFINSFEKYNFVKMHWFTLHLDLPLTKSLPFCVTSTYEIMVSIFARRYSFSSINSSTTSLCINRKASASVMPTPRPRNALQLRPHFEA